MKCGDKQMRVKMSKETNANKEEDIECVIMKGNKKK